ncbi:Fe(3+)-hydroxamate ABC transporter permease FhuB [Ensifer adhaerens]|uniref:Fe(3+)-hydroxamate ABC transporter permease FhuB n=1 Tax=Ensifer adhaerens TaxID=106592 RepID=UPI001AEB66D3|nr:Fe(3+)-hydroxamate ABC transporter permease FhuB [Ensifer adhaerens]
MPVNILPTRNDRVLRISPGLLVLSMAGLALLFSVRLLTGLVPIARWPDAIWAADGGDVPSLLFVYSHLPRIAISILAGAALGLAGTLLQQVLRNPLAEPTTLGISTGAQLALVIALLWQPWLLDHGRETVAIAGALLAAAAVFAVARSGQSSPLSLVMAGLVVNMTLGAISGVAVLYNHEYLSELFVWQSGRLEQSGWSQVLFLAPRLACAFIVSLLLTRPLALMELGDEGAQSLGLRMAGFRPVALLVAVALSASVVAAVGVIAFVGLAVPTLVSLAGARRLKERLLWAPAFGGSLLWLADQLVQQVAIGNTTLPTGVATALLGAPLLLVLLPGLRNAAAPPAVSFAAARRLDRPWLAVSMGLAVLGLALLGALAVGKTMGGWTVAGGDAADFVARWRGARVLAALSAGTLLGLAGTMIQRMTGNALASPEILGISSGASLGAIALTVVLPGFGLASLTAATTASAGLTLIIMLAVSRTTEFSPQRLILAGVALGTFVAALSEMLIATGGSSRTFLLSWMSGSTYRVTWDTAIAAACIATVSLFASPLFARWLDVLPLGESSARSLGMNIGQARGCIAVACALMTAGATIVIGPLSFVGLVAPHLARAVGISRALPHLVAAAIAGSTIMVLADWLGRLLIFPWQIPAGLLAALVGGPYFLVLMWRRA